MEYLREFIMTEMKAGNYIVAGGDWNQNPPGFTDTKTNTGSGYENFILKAIPESFLDSEWSWVFDPKQATNRSLKTAFTTETSSTVLDFFLVSPNITPLNIRTINMDFEYSDHHPVLIQLRIDQ